MPVTSQPSGPITGDVLLGVCNLRHRDNLDTRVRLSTNVYPERRCSSYSRLILARCPLGLLSVVQNLLVRYESDTASIRRKREQD